MPEPWSLLIVVLTQPIELRRSIRQGCPLSPLLFVIVANALGWLVSNAIDKGNVKCIKITDSLKPLCLQQFAGDTNALIQNEPESKDNL